MASVCVITIDALEPSVRSVPTARTPVSHTGKNLLISLLLLVLPAGHSGPQPGHLGLFIHTNTNLGFLCTASNNAQHFPAVNGTARPIFIFYFYYTVSFFCATTSAHCCTPLFCTYNYTSARYTTYSYNLLNIYIKYLIFFCF